MGQQQLLILVLTVIIVGIAAVIGADMFSDSMVQRQSDLLISYSVHIATDAAAWRGKSSPYLGGGGSYAELEGPRFSDLLINQHRIPGAIEIQKATTNQLILRAQSCDVPEIGVRVTVDGVNISSTEIAYDGSITFEGTQGTGTFEEICAGSGYGD